MLPVKSKPPSVDRAAKPATPVMPRRDSGAGIVYVQDVHAPEGLLKRFDLLFFKKKKNDLCFAKIMPLFSAGVNPSMLPGVRSAPPSRALHPEL